MRRGTGDTGRTDAMRMVRADLCRRLAVIEAGVAHRGALGLRSDADAIAAIAADYGLLPVVRLAEGLSVALGAGGRGAAIGPWIERLRDAIDCEAVDAGASDTWLASVMVRFAG